METERLILRELEITDAAELYNVLGNPRSMKYYPAPFDRDRVERWINWNLDNYAAYNHGLWGVILKEDMTFLGDCGITMQDIEGNKLPELGYHIREEYCGKGYATEAAKACVEYAFTTFGYKALYTYTHHENTPSIRVAEKCGMRFVKFFEKEVMGEQVKEALYCLVTAHNTVENPSLTPTPPNAWPPIPSPVDPSLVPPPS